jgi:hypothetical protein
MIWLSEIWASLTLGQVLIGIAIAAGSFVVAFAVIKIVLILMPANFFHSEYTHHFLPDRNPLIRFVAILAKNLLGACLIVFGVLLSLPGIPGPGLLTIFIGLVLVDLPGKRRFEAKIIQRPFILNAVNRMRTKYNKPPLIID